MQLIERYLTEIEAHLPQDQRDDIVVELRNDLAEQVAARADEADRAPTIADESAVLAPLGHPLKLASSYKARRYLIGPELYPAYLQTLKTTLLIVLAAIVLLSLAFGTATDWNVVVKGLLDSFIDAAVWVVVIVTGVFLALESSGEGVEWYDGWKPEDLKVSSEPVVYSDLITNLVGEGVFLLWWNGLILGDWSFADSGEFALTLSEIWGTLFWPLNILFVAFFALHVWVLLNSAWVSWASVTEIVLCVALLAALVSLASHQPLLVVQSEYGVGQWFERTLLSVLGGIAVFTVWDGVLAYRRLR